MNLTANQIRYLLVIKKLNEQKHVVKSVDIARKLGYSRASVHKMLKYLKEKSYVKQEPYCSVSITNVGLKVANECNEKYMLIQEQLKPVVDIDDEFNLGVCNIIEHM